MTFLRRLATAAFLAATVLVVARPVGAQTTPTVTVSGLVYAQYQYLASDTLDHYNAFDVTRAYLTAQGVFPHGVAARITGDVFRAADGSIDYRLKYAYFQWRPTDKAPVDFRFGQTQTPWLDWQEGMYVYRFEGTMPMERAGYITSSDLGLAMDFFSKDQAFNGSVGVYNGEGYHGAESGQHKDVEARASLRLLPSDLAGPRGGLRVSGYAGIGATDPAGLARQRYIGQLSYASNMFTVAGEFGATRDGGAGTTSDVDGRVISGWGWLSLPGSPASVLLRVDHVDPNTSAGDDASTRFIGGLGYVLTPNIRLLADVDAVSYQAATLTAAQQKQKTALQFQTQFSF